VILNIKLTEEQSRLYLNSHAFRRGVEQFLRDILPHHIDKIATEAESTEASNRARLRADMSTWATFQEGADDV
jgi:Mn-dependent DtxR family transcriptional regulator